MGIPNSNISGRVALVTGAARGQGRSHAIRLAELGADVVLVDVCADLPTIPYSQPGPKDLAETTRLVEATGRAAVAVIADVRDGDAMAGAVDTTLNRFGRIDIVCANAGDPAETGDRNLCIGLGRRHWYQPDRGMEHDFTCNCSHD